MTSENKEQDSAPISVEDQQFYSTPVGEDFEEADSPTGLDIWKIVNTTPIPLLDVDMYGRFREGDCYIIYSVRMGSSWFFSKKMYPKITKKKNQNK